MGTRFTRVTVVGDGRQLDISLPADAPLAEQVPTVLRLLSVPVGAAPVHWRLVAPEFGAIDPARSLHEVGVLDGTVLHLTEAAAAPPPPFVDDVETAVADLVADAAPAWSGSARTDVVGRLLAAVLLVALVVAVYSALPAAPIALLLVAVVGLMVGAVVPGRGGWACALVAVPAAAALVVEVPAAYPTVLGSAVPLPPTVDRGRAPHWIAAVLPADLGWALNWNGLPLAVVAGAALALATVGVVRRASGVAVGSLLMTLVAVAALLSVRLGLPTDRTAGLALLVAVVVSALGGRLAVGGAGLVELMAADERGDPVPRERVDWAVRRGLSLTTGLVRAAAAVAVVACWVLVAGRAGGVSEWPAPAVGLLGGVLFGLRSRMFSRTEQVGAMLAVAVAAGAAAAVAAPRWLGLGSAAGSALTFGGLALLGVVVLMSGVLSLGEVTGARIQRILERLELLAVLAVVPGLVLLFRVIPMVQRWWG